MVGSSNPDKYYSKRQMVDDIGEFFISYGMEDFAEYFKQTPKKLIYHWSEFFLLLSSVIKSGDAIFLRDFQSYFLLDNQDMVLPKEQYLRLCELFLLNSAHHEVRIQLIHLLSNFTVPFKEKQDVQQQLLLMVDTYPTAKYWLNCLYAILILKEPTKNELQTITVKPAKELVAASDIGEIYHLFRLFPIKMEQQFLKLNPEDAHKFLEKTVNQSVYLKERYGILHATLNNGVFRRLAHHDRFLTDVLFPFFKNPKNNQRIKGHLSRKMVREGYVRLANQAFDHTFSSKDQFFTKRREPAKPRSPMEQRACEFLGNL